MSATARSSARPVPDFSASENRDGAWSGNTSERRSNVASGSRRRAWRSTTRSTTVATTSSISSHTTNGKNVRGRSVNFVTVSTASVAATKGMRNVSALTAKANPRRGRHRLSSIPETSLRAEPPVADVPSFAAVPGSATLTLDSSGAGLRARHGPRIRVIGVDAVAELCESGAQTIFRGASSRASAASAPSARIDGAVDEHVAHALGLVGDEPFAVGGEVADAAQRSGRDRVGVEHDDVGGLADLERAAVVRARTPRPARR